MTRHVIVTGAAGFIGSHLVDRLLAEGNVVTGIDNLSRGSSYNLRKALSHPQFRLLEADLAKLTDFRRAVLGMGGTCSFDEVWHMAASSDIAAGIVDPGVDLNDTFLTTYNTLLIMREFGIKEIAFASTSAVYGDQDRILAECNGPFFPISNYGAMKLASEGIITAAVESYVRRADIFRFPNVIGPRATHGIIYDLVRKLKTDCVDLEVLGDGNQQKPYLHVSELVDAMFFIRHNSFDRINFFNIGAADDGATVRYIAETVLSRAASDKRIRYTGGSKGWVGDVARFRYSIDKLKSLGWRPLLHSEEAVRRAVDEIFVELNS